MVKPILVFQTDFTYKEGAISSMYGVVKTVDRSLEIFDGTHEIPHFDTWSASYRLYQSMQFWPKGTIFVSVVDPGVGTARKACVARTKDGYYIVTPDNGSLSHVKYHIGIEEVREIDEKVNRLQSTLGTSVFHGRDLFGYCAARLASGIITYEQVGPMYSIEDIKVHHILEGSITGNRAEGIIEIDDPNFGNLWSNINSDLLLNNGFAYGDKVKVTICCKGDIVYQEEVLFAKSFGYVAKGESVLYTNELMRASMAMCLGDFRKRYQLGFGEEWTISIENFKKALKL
jgi:S-adenosylmethionine hydrolase